MAQLVKRVRLALAGWLARIAPEKSFVRNILTLAGGTALAQGLSGLVSPLLTRLYSPQDFGILAVYVAIFSLAGVLALSFSGVMQEGRVEKAARRCMWGLSNLSKRTGEHIASSDVKSYRSAKGVRPYALTMYSLLATP